MISFVILSCSATNLAKATGSRYCGVVPTEAANSVHSLLSTAFLTRALILSMTALGVPFGSSKTSPLVKDQIHTRFLHRGHVRPDVNSFLAADSQDTDLASLHLAQDLSRMLARGINLPAHQGGHGQPGPEGDMNNLCADLCRPSPRAPCGSRCPFRNCPPSPYPGFCLI